MCNSNYKITQGDCMDAMVDMDENSVHAVVTDPPYNFEGGFMGEEWDDIGTSNEYQAWCEQWATECLRILKPGGHLIAFSSTKAYHQLASGVESAGFTIHDQIDWVYGQGFPKSTDIGKEIDKWGGNPGLKREIGKALKAARISRGLSTTVPDEMFCDGSSNYRWYEGRPKGQHLPDDETFERIVDEWPELQEYAEKVREANREVIGTGHSGKTAMMGGLRNETPGGEYEITAPATTKAEKWDGWKTSLKPAHEPAVLARAPLSEPTVAENVLEHGTGAFNTKAAEIVGEDRDRYPANVAVSEGATDLPESYFYTSKARESERTIDGRVENDHSTVKPLDLMEWIVALVTAPGQTVLDPFAGSGTTIMACRRLRREAVGIEKDPDYADLARKRVDLADELKTDWGHGPHEDGQQELEAFTDGGESE